MYLIIVFIAPPNIQRKTRDISAVANKPLKIDIDVNGTPEFKYEW